jgi:homoserine dehydrogenase
MPENPSLKLGFIGLGVVGQGVWKHILRHKEAFKSRLGVELELYRAAVRDLSRPRLPEIPAAALTEDPASIVEDPDVDIVCELMGGTSLAKELTLNAFRNGKTVVTANKALICEHGTELFETARKNGTHYLFEASVAGGIPVIKALREGLVANRFSHIFGILNGTSNYILTRMEREGLAYEDVLGEARKLGYVEADEALDLDGVDAAHKAAILAYLAHGRWISLEEMVVEGIREVSLLDIGAARDLGYKIKLIAIIEKNFETQSIRAGVHPMLVPLDEIIARVDDVYNAVSIKGDVAGNTILIGRGAGQDATASAVISDIVDAVKSIRQGDPADSLRRQELYYNRISDGSSIAGLDEIEGCFYLRLSVQDKPGVLAKVTEILANAHISLSTVDQTLDGATQTANLILTTHTTTEKAMAEAVAKLAVESSVLGKPVLLRIFEPPS